MNATRPEAAVQIASGPGSGRRAIVHEASREVGARFRGDLQGSESWPSRATPL